MQKWTKKKKKQSSILDHWPSSRRAAVAARPMTEFARLNYGLLHGYFFSFRLFVAFCATAATQIAVYCCSFFFSLSWFLSCLCCAHLFFSDWANGWWFNAVHAMGDFKTFVCLSTIMIFLERINQSAHVCLAPKFGTCHPLFKWRPTECHIQL